jgi:hypothetical protein
MMLRKRRRWDEVFEEDPAAGLLNLFDVWIAFAAALLLALVGYWNVPELLNAKSEVVVVKNPGQANMEIIRKQGVKLERYRATDQKLTGEGRRLGTAYRLASGEVVYVPESDSVPSAETPATPAPK